MGSDFIPEARISNAAYKIIVDYGIRYATVVCPPVPVEDILERYFDLSFELRDMSQALGRADVLGAIDISRKHVFVDYQLDPYEFPNQLGRYHFTVAHELGHWVLHRHEVLEGHPLFDGRPGMICRDTTAKPPKEIQADRFAAHLLMPEEMVRNCWPDVTGSDGPHDAVSEIAERQTRIKGAKLPVVAVAKKMAAVFATSGEAMQNRLIKLGLILTTPPQATLF